LIVEDLSRIDEEFILFCDDHSFLDPQRMDRLHALIEDRGITKRYFAYTRADCVVQHPRLFEKWADIGLALVMTGLEALDDADIRAVRKGTSAEINERAIAILERAGIGLSAGFLVRPDFAAEDFRRIDAYVEARPIIVMTELTPLTPLPGTELYEQAAGQVTTEHRELYDLAHFVTPTELPLREMYALLRRFYRRSVWRTIRRLRLYRPGFLLRPHAARLLWGVWRVDRMMRAAHRYAHAEPPGKL
jgi:radical SAM superfamily enzyme YgiQ (UPF0313 family)